MTGVAIATPGIVGSNGVQISGATSGTTTVKATAVAGTTTQTLPAVTGTVQSTTGTNLALTDVYQCTGSVTANNTTTYAIVTGLTGSVAVGTYRFKAYLPSTVASGTGGIKYAFKLTTTVLSAMEATGMGCTASAVAVQHTTTATDLADLFSQAAVVLYTELTGTFTVSTAGTMAIHMAQNTANASNTVALIGGSLEFTRIS